jgi:hypothetical protein
MKALSLTRQGFRRFRTSRAASLPVQKIPHAEGVRDFVVLVLMRNAKQEVFSKPDKFIRHLPVKRHRPTIGLPFLEKD